MVLVLALAIQTTANIQKGCKTGICYTQKRSTTGPLILSAVPTHSP